jgi:hypothetical protein
MFFWLIIAGIALGYIILIWWVVFDERKPAIKRKRK